MGYKVVERDQKFFIYEKKTNQFVWQSNVETEMYRMVRKLNLGAGFQGFTPSFFTMYFEQLSDYK